MLNTELPLVVIHLSAEEYNPEVGSFYDTKLYLEERFNTIEEASAYYTHMLSLGFTAFLCEDGCPF